MRSTKELERLGQLADLRRRALHATLLRGTRDEIQRAQRRWWEARQSYDTEARRLGMPLLHERPVKTGT